jgi:acetyl esterase/lipase
MKLILFLFPIFIGCASYKGDIPFKTETFFYTQEKNERQSGEAYIPLKGENLPGVIMVHGGGWSARSYEDNRSIAKSLASQGYAVININHRYAPKHRHPAPIEDLGMAIAWFKKNASRFNLNADKIGLWGYSSGGHITSLYALQKIGTPDAVQAVVSGGTPYDLTWYTHSPIISPYIGGNREKKFEEYFQASPSWNIKKGAPPFFIYQAANDKLVEYAQATSFEARMKREGNSIKRFKVPYWGHAFSFILSDEAVKKGIKFLNKELKGVK